MELLELIQSLDFKVIHHLEKACEAVKRGSHHYLGVSCEHLSQDDNKSECHRIKKLQVNSVQGREKITFDLSKFQIKKL